MSESLSFGGANGADYGEAEAQHHEFLSPIPFTWGPFIRADLEELHEIVERTLTRGGLSVVYGDSGSGKTTMALDLAFRIPGGHPWLGRRVERGVVIYIAGEGAASVRRRLEAFRRHHNRVLGAFGLISTSLNLMDPSVDVENLIQLIKERAEEIGGSVLLVIVDTLARAMGGANENASEDMARIVSAADRIREETGAHVMFVHHCGKDAARGARGHSSLRAAVDTEIEVTAEEGSAVHTLTITKQRDLDSVGDRLSGRFVPVELGVNQWGNPITACVVEPVDKPSAHMQALLDETAMQRADDVAAAGYGRLLTMGVKPTDGHTSPDYLPRQIIDKGLGDGFKKPELVGAMNRLMTRGVLRRAVIGQYSNRQDKFGLVMAEGEQP